MNNLVCIQETPGVCAVQPNQERAQQEQLFADGIMIFVLICFLVIFYKLRKL